MRRYVSNAELEELGEGIIRHYTGGEKREQIDIEDLIVRYFGLPLRYERFAGESGDRMGFLSDGKTPLKIVCNGAVKERIFPRNTIVLDRFLLRQQENGRRRFTMAHELSHYLLQRHDPVQMAAFKREFHAGKTYTLQEMREMHSISEAQADRLAAVLLMPKAAMENALNKYNCGRFIRVYGRNVIAPSEKLVMQEIADHLGVSYTALYYRLKELKMLEVRDLEEYVSAYFFEEEFYGQQ